RLFYLVTPCSTTLRDNQYLSSKFAGGVHRCAPPCSPFAMMEMHVRVDAAWHDDMSCCVDQMLGSVGRQRSGSGDRGDRLARDVPPHDALGCHHIAAANHEIKHPASWHRQGPDAWLAQALIDAVLICACEKRARRILGRRQAA